MLELRNVKKSFRIGENETKALDDVSVSFREKEFVSKDKNYEEMEEIKRIKQQRKAKIYAALHINDIKAFFTKLFDHISKFIHTRKAKKKEKEEMGGM